MNRFEEIRNTIIENNLVQFFFEYYSDETESYFHIENTNVDFELENIDQALIYLERFLNLEDFEIVDYECNSDIMYCVVHFKKDNMYIKLEGEYDSYGQYNHDYFNKKSRINQVFPKTIEKIIYE